jgi:protein phosphatase 1 regulatory subunit 7
MHRLVHKEQDVWWEIDGENVAAAALSISQSEVKTASFVPGDKFKKNDLNFMLELSAITSFSVDHPVDISALAECINLRKLYIGGSITKGCEIGRLINLEELTLGHSGRQNLPDSDMPILRKFWIWDLRASDLQFLKCFASLEDLTIIEARKLDSLSGIEYCPNLQKLDIGYCSKLENINGLLSCKNLIEIEMTNLKRLTSMRPIFHLSKLQRLIVEKVPSVKDIAGIKELKSLNHLAWIDTEIEDGDLSPLLAMPNLTHCYVRPNKKHYQPTTNYLYDTIKARTSITD